jgi:hypothetical protein
MSLFTMGDEIKKDVSDEDWQQFNGLIKAPCDMLTIKRHYGV